MLVLRFSCGLVSSVWSTAIPSWSKSCFGLFRTSWQYLVLTGQHLSKIRTWHVYEVRVVWCCAGGLNDIPGYILSDLPVKPCAIPFVIPRGFTSLVRVEAFQLTTSLIAAGIGVMLGEIMIVIYQTFTAIHQTND